MRRVLAVLAVASLALTGCADSPEEAGGETPTASSTPSETSTATETPTSTASESPTDAASAPDAIEVEIEGDRIEPNGKRVKVATGETVLLAVESDRAAELHVHSSPEQVLSVEPGEQTLELVIDRPGLVDVEEHDSGLVVLQLEVR